MKFNKILLFIFVLFGLVSGVSAISVTDNNFYFSYDNDDLTGNDPNDLSINNLDGVNNGATINQTGILNEAFDYDGVNDNVTTNYSIPNTNSPYTISTWVFRDTAISTDAIIGQTNLDSGLPAGLIYGISGTTDIFFVHSGITTTTGTGFTTGSWHYVVMTYDGSGLVRGYLNGVNIGNGTGTPSAISSNDLVIGKYGTHVNHHFDGRIDETSVWDRVLTNSEINELYNNGSALNPYDTLSQLEFNNITANNITLINNSFFNNSIQFQTFVTNTSTNGNINHSYSLNGASLVQYATNVLNGSTNLNLSEGSYNISFFAQNNETNVSSSNFSFLVDKTLPVIQKLQNISENSFEINFSTIFNVTDVLSGLASCTINITELENVTLPDNMLINCSDTETFQTAGLHNLFLTAVDNAGNINTYTENFTINPFIFISFYDVENNINLTNYLVNILHPDNRTTIQNDVNGTIFLTPVNNGSLDLGNHTITFIKNGYPEQNFTQLVNSTNAGTNVTFNINPSIITILIKDIDTGNLTTPSNFTLLVNDLVSQTSESFNIVNNNTFEYPNILGISTQLSFSIIGSNGTIITSVAVIPPRQNINLSLYVTTDQTEPRVFEVLSPSLTVIPNSDVFLYVFIENVGFVLQSQVKTNGVGKVSFNIIPLTKIYTLCNTFNDIEKCLQQVTFQNILIDPTQIIHDQDLEGNPKNVLSFISWSFIENKTNISSEMTFIFNDEQSITSQFCMNVSRVTNNTIIEELGDFCVLSSSGNVVQSFALSQNQYIDYKFLYVFENQTILLNRFKSYFDGVLLDELKENSIFDFLFLFIFFGSLSLLLRYNNFDWYNVGIFLVMTILYIVQAVISENYIYLEVWGFMLFKVLALYSVRYEV